jgi:hypothetical protein
VSAYHATEDEHGVVSLYRSGTLVMFMHRREWDTLRKELAMGAVGPERVESGGSVLYGIERSAP